MIVLKIWLCRYMNPFIISKLWPRPECVAAVVCRSCTNCRRSAVSHGTQHYNERLEQRWCKLSSHPTSGFPPSRDDIARLARLLSQLGLFMCHPRVCTSLCVRVCGCRQQDTGGWWVRRVCVKGEQGVTGTVWYDWVLLQTGSTRSCPLSHAWYSRKWLCLFRFKLFVSSFQGTHFI